MRALLITVLMFVVYCSSAQSDSILKNRVSTDITYLIIAGMLNVEYERLLPNTNTSVSLSYLHSRYPLFRNEQAIGVKHYFKSMHQQSFWYGASFVLREFVYTETISANGRLFRNDFQRNKLALIAQGGYQWVFGAVNINLHAGFGPKMGTLFIPFNRGSRERSDVESAFLYYLGVRTGISF